MDFTYNATETEALNYAGYIYNPSSTSSPV